MQRDRKKKVRSKVDHQERAIKQLLLAAELNPNYYHYFKQRKIDFNTLIELSAEDLNIIGITDEAERNALLRCTEVMQGPNSHFTVSPAFDIEKIVENTTSIILFAHTDLIKMKRHINEKKMDYISHKLSNPFVELGHTATSTSLHFLKLIDQGLHIVENDYSIMLDLLDENKARKECRPYQRILCVTSSVFLTVLIGGLIIKRFLW